MPEWLQNLDMFTKLSLIFVFPALIFLVVTVILEYLRFTDPRSEYSYPGFFTVTNLPFYFSVEGIVSMVLHIGGMSNLVSVLLGILCGAVSTPIVWKASKMHCSAKHKRISEEYAQFVGREGVVVKQVGKYGGRVSLRLNDRSVKAEAVADEVINTGERVRVVDYSNQLLICKKL